MRVSRDRKEKIRRMDIIKVNSDTGNLLPTVATIGFFDGVHRGHQYLIRNVVEEARRSHMTSTVITFDRHPRQVLQSDYRPKLLTTLDGKLLQLSKTGCDQAAVLSFSREMAALSARDFMRYVLVDKLNVRKLFIGYDNRFGHNRSEGFSDYVRYGREMGIEVIRNAALSVDGAYVSSSMIRSLLQEGEVAMAHQCLGRPYMLTGTVVGGYRNGHKLGFPTANIDVADTGLLIPSPGVYAVRVRPEHHATMMNGMMNIGIRPTFDGHEQTLEVHIFDFEEELYGQRMEVWLTHRIRSERKFENIVQLAEQLKADRRQAEELLRARDNQPFNP